MESMAQRRFHYEQAFEYYLRANRVPYVAVDEAKKSLLPEGEVLGSLKSFDFVVYGPGRNLLLDVKGRKLTGRGRRLENWVTRDDVDSLERWSQLFGPRFEPTFVFAYWCDAQPADALFEELFDFNGRWYALREVTLAAYRRVMMPRSTRWGTVSVPAGAFDRVSRPFTIRAARAPIGAASGGPDRLGSTGAPAPRAWLSACGQCATAVC